MKKQIKIILATLTAIALLAGCAADKSSSAKKKDKKSNDTNEEYIAEETAAPEYYLEAEMADGDYNRGLSSYKSADVDLSAYNGDYDDYSAATEAAGDQSAQTTPQASSGQKLIRTVNISVETVDFDGLNKKIKATVDKYDGYFESSNIYGTGNNKDLRIANYKIRVPADQLDSVINDIEGSCTLISSSESTQDVTLSYIDNESHVASLRAEQDALMKMLEEATDLDTIIMLQDRLTDIRYEIEYYESTLRSMDNRIEYATLCVSIEEVVEETPVEKPEKPVEKKPEKTYNEELKDSYSDSVSNLKENAKQFLIDFMAFLPYLIIFAIIAVIVIIVILIVVKKKKSKKNKGEKAPSADNKPDESDKKEVNDSDKK